MGREARRRAKARAQQLSDLQQRSDRGQHGAIADMGESSGTGEGDSLRRALLSGRADGLPPVAELAPDPSAPAIYHLPIYVTGATLARVFSVHPKTIERWRKTDGLPCLRIRGTVRYDASDVSRWASARKEGV